MIIKNVEIRCCQTSTDMGASSLKSHSVNASETQSVIDFLVVTLTTECGLSASMFGFAGKSALGSGYLAASCMPSLLIGKHALDREKIWQEFRVANRWWHHLPMYSYGPFDCCLWLLGAMHAGQPLWRYIGGLRNRVPVYTSSLVLPDAEAYQAEALAVKNAGFCGYKIHPPGKQVEEDIEIHRAVRQAVGEEFALMSDPVAPYRLSETIQFAQAIEELNYLWLEEPLPDESFSALKKLKSKVSVPIVGAEVLPHHPYSVAEAISSEVFDAVRADVSWSGGITGVLKTAHLADAFHMNCELHTTIFHPLEMVNLHVAAAINNTTYAELLFPTHTFSFGLKQPLPIQNGYATLPESAGLGVDLDWDFIDNATVLVL
ncbi:enolase C-terminal domain-like protein [Vibrio nigripulchritudo]|uniref:enolase C-terminal domain-like protein n=1 Tax=Vibrio nigripulchritudo TaxID=28173 RepID=UPI00061FD9A6|nr:enolase C-terminal domain-like protein [Vibrio nigripulchritudo]KJY75914.1 mandelate racemase [Vibrio nigripulchritudo]